jgi:hypothetical protein
MRFAEASVFCGSASESIECEAGTTRRYDARIDTAVRMDLMA